jgi:hypothetical protein
MSLRAVVVLDYQNVHLTAHDVFDHAGDKHDALIHPMLFAQTVARIRNQRQREGHPLAHLTGVHVFRGLPHTDYDWEQSRRCSAQAEEWRRAGAHVTLRDLKYRFQRQSDGSPATDVKGHKIPTSPGREKGIDVLVALTCIRQALRENVDLVILASRDTDLVPVLDTLLDMRAEDSRVAKVETTSWFNRKAAEEGNYAGGHLRTSDGRRVWNTNLDRAAFEASRDRRDYE